MDYAQTQATEKQPANFTLLYEYKLKLLEAKIDKEFALIKKELSNINESLRQKKIFVSRVNVGIIVCAVSSLVVFMFDLLQRLPR